MPGSPPTTSLLALPRYDNVADPIDFATEINAIIDQLDAVIQTMLARYGHGPGEMKLSAAVSPPAGWLTCNGAAVSRTTYAALFAAIGTAFGAGNGSTTFNVPDCQGRTLVGAGTGAGLSARAFASKFGEENHGLSAAEMPVHAHGVSDPSHAHSINDPSHYHLYNNNVPYCTGGWFGANVETNPKGVDVVHNVPYNNNEAVGNVGATLGSGVGVAYGASGSGLSLLNNGSNVVHSNMQPFGVANVFIRTT